MRYFEDLQLGQTTVFDGSYPVTEEEIMEVGNRWDPQPFHIDPEAAAQSHFGGLVASSVHAFAMATAIGNKSSDQFRCAAETALGFNKMQWHGAIRPGDVMTMQETVQDLRTSKSRPHCGIVTMHCEMLNQKDELTFSYQVSFLIRLREAG